jgi:hypothetical protein
MMQQNDIVCNIAPDILTDAFNGNGSGPEKMINACRKMTNTMKIVDSGFTVLLSIMLYTSTHI